MDSVTASRREVHPGEKIQLRVLLTGENAAETIRQGEYQVPIGAEEGPLYFTVADAGTANISDFRQILTASPHTPGQLITTVNDLHPNTKAYVRVWRASRLFNSKGPTFRRHRLPSRSFSKTRGPSQAGITQLRNSKIAEMEIDRRRAGHLRRQNRSGGCKGK